MSFSLDLSAILQGLTVALLLWGLKSLANISKRQTEQHVILTGAKGDNGLVGTVQELRHRTHKHGDEIQVLRGKQELHDFRLTELERGAA